MKPQSHPDVTDGPTAPPAVRCSELVSRPAKLSKRQIAKACSDARKAVSKMTPKQRDRLLKIGLALVNQRRNMPKAANAALCDPAHGDAGKPETL